MAHEAALAGDALGLEAWLSSHSDCNATNENLQGRTILHCAAYSGSVPCVEALLRYKSIDLNRKDRLGLSPLQCACFKNRIEVVQLLIKAGADVNQVDRDHSSALQKACQEGYKEVVEALLVAPGCDPNLEDANGLTALHIATERGHAAIVQILVRHGADPNKQDVDGQTPLHVATYHIHPKTVRYLLKKAASPELADVEGATPLHLAAWIGNRELVCMLASAMIEPSTSVDLDGQTALSLASEQGNVDVVKALLEMDDEEEQRFERSKRERLATAAASAAHVVTNTITPSSVSSSSTTTTPSPTRERVSKRNASSKDDSSDHSSPPTSPRKSNKDKSSHKRSKKEEQVDADDVEEKKKKHAAAAAGSVKDTTSTTKSSTQDTSTESSESALGGPHAARQFPSLHIDMIPDILGETPLHKASLYNRPEVLEILLKKMSVVAARRAAGGDSTAAAQHAISSSSASYTASSDIHVPSSSSPTPPHPSSSSYAASFVPSYSVDVVDLRNATALLGASFNGNSKCVSLLLEAGANVNHQDEEGATALHKASFNGHVEVLGMLIAKQSDIEKPDASGATPLHKAAFNGQTGAVQMLCKVGAKVNAVDLQGGTALHNASYGGHLEAVHAILRFLALTPRDIAATDADGFNALHMAASQGHDHIITTLIKHRDSPFQIDASTHGGWTPIILALKQQHASTALLLARMGAKFNLDKALARRLRNVPQSLLLQVQHEANLYSGGGGGSERGSSSAKQRKMSLSSAALPSFLQHNVQSHHHQGSSANLTGGFSSNPKQMPGHSVSQAHINISGLGPASSSSSAYLYGTTAKRRKTDRPKMSASDGGVPNPATMAVSGSPSLLTGSEDSPSSRRSPRDYNSDHPSTSSSSSSTSKKDKLSKRKSSKKEKKRKGTKSPKSGTGEIPPLHGSQNHHHQHGGHGQSASSPRSDQEFDNDNDDSELDEQPASPHQQPLNYATDSGLAPTSSSYYDTRSGSPTVGIPGSKKSSRRASSSADPALTSSAPGGRRRGESVSITVSSNSSYGDHLYSSASSPSSPLISSHSQTPVSHQHPTSISPSPSFNSYDLARRPSAPRKSFKRQNDPPEVTQALELFKRNPGDAIELLIEADLLEDNCSAVARWLFDRDDIDRASLGLFLSRDKNWNTAILESYVDLFDFVDMEFDMALRRFLSKFRLPGEAQKIDILMEKFATKYYAQNANKVVLGGGGSSSSSATSATNTTATGTSSSSGSAGGSLLGPLFADKDAIYVLAFSVIMLNTDAHNPAIKKANKMTKAQFIRNVSGINGGRDFPDKFLSELYEKIIMYEIKMDSESMEDGGRAGAHSPGTGGGDSSTSGGGAGGSSSQGGGSSSNSSSSHKSSSNDASSVFQNAELKGYLMKQGGKVKSWKKRWFVLDGNCLFYFASSSDKDPLGIIPLENLLVNPAFSSKRRHTFILQNPNEGPIKATVRKGSQMIVGNHENYLFQAANEQELALWIDSLNRNIFRNPFYLLLANKKKQMETKGKAKGSSSSSSSAAPSHSSVSSHASPPKSSVLSSSSSNAAGGAALGSPSSASSSAAGNSSPTSSRRSKTSTSAGISRTDSIFVKSSPPASPTSAASASASASASATGSLKVRRDSSATSMVHSDASSLTAATTTTTTSGSQKLSKQSHSSSSSRQSFTATPRQDDSDPSV